MGPGTTVPIPLPLLIGSIRNETFGMNIEIILLSPEQLWAQPFGSLLDSKKVCFPSQWLV